MEDGEEPDPCSPRFSTLTINDGFGRSLCVGVVCPLVGSETVESQNIGRDRREKQTVLRGLSVNGKQLAREERVTY